MLEIPFTKWKMQLNWKDVDQMRNKILVVAPHPDDETLGCGGTLLRHKKNGDEIYWMIVTNIDVKTKEA